MWQKTKFESMQNQQKEEAQIAQKVKAESAKSDKDDGEIDVSSLEDDEKHDGGEAKEGNISGNGNGFRHEAEDNGNCSSMAMAPAWREVFLRKYG